MEKTAIILLIGLIALSGCTQQNQNNDACIQVITPAISPNGICKEFRSPCDVPTGYTMAESCEQEETPIETPPVEETPVCAQVITPAISPEGNCIEFPTPCDVPTGYTTTSACPPEIEIIPEPAQKFNFDANLLFCEYDSLLDRYNFAYQIRNYTDNTPTYGSKIWMKFDTGEGQAKTIQGKYKNGQLLWEEQLVSHIKLTYRGQFWDIRGAEFANHEFTLIYCEPENADKEKCTPETGIVITSGNTEQMCK